MSFLNNSNLIAVSFSDPEVANNMTKWHSFDFSKESWIDYVIPRLCLIVVHPTSK